MIITERSKFGFSINDRIQVVRNGMSRVKGVMGFEGELVCLGDAGRFIGEHLMKISNKFVDYKVHYSELKRVLDNDEIEKVILSGEIKLRWNFISGDRGAYLEPDDWRPVSVTKKNVEVESGVIPNHLLENALLKLFPEAYRSEPKLTPLEAILGRQENLKRPRQPHPYLDEDATHEALKELKTL